MGANFALTTGRINEADRLYRDGGSIYQIAKLMGVSATAVRNALILIGVPLRSRAQAAVRRTVTLEDIKARCVVDERSECWNWTGCVQANGYGRITVKRKAKYVHRVACELATGVPLGRRLALHECDNRRCCNPDHLRPGTHLDNSKDAIERGRVSRGVSHSLAVMPHTRSRAKLNMEKAKEIRRRAAAGETAEELGAAFGVDTSNVRLIVRNKTWREASPMSV